MGENFMNGNFVAVIIIIVLAIVGVGWMIYQSSSFAEAETEAVSVIPLVSEDATSPTPKKPLPDTKWLEESLRYFMKEKEETSIQTKKTRGSLSFTPLYSPLSQRFGVASMLSLYGFSLGVVYTGDLYVSAGYTFYF